MLRRDVVAGFLASVGLALPFERLLSLGVKTEWASLMDSRQYLANCIARLLFFRAAGATAVLSLLF